MTEDIEILIAKYFANQIVDSEEKELKRWLQKKGNRRIFEEYIEINYGINSIENEMSNKKVMELISEREINKSYYSFVKYAAVFVLGFGIYYLSNFLQHKIDVNTPFSLEDDSIVLTLSNGEKKIIDIDSEIAILDNEGGTLGSQIGAEIIYHKKEKNNDDIVYNTIDVPYGKKFKLTLSDGTQIDLNSGSVLKYPENFHPNKTRKVFLEGEAYFAVTKTSSKSKFVVETKDFDVNVLGTQFNVSAYYDSQSKHVVLAEGSVEITKNADVASPVLLKPNQIATFNQGIDVIDVNVGKYVSWKRGELLFDKDPFSYIVKKLTRHFNVEIISNNKKLNKKKFTGRFNKENVLEILEIFKAHTPFQYTVKNNSIIIK